MTERNQSGRDRLHMTGEFECVYCRQVFPVLGENFTSLWNREREGRENRESGRERKTIRHYSDHSENFAIVCEREKCIDEYCLLFSPEIIVR